jgi:glucan-binding YG repeat protein
MKTIIMGLLFLFTTSAIIAQNKNVKDETKTTTTTIKNSKGERKIVKTEEIKEVQEIKFENPNSSETNKDMKPTPVIVTTTNELTVDGETKYIDVDHSSYYDLDGTKYEIKSDKKGYLLLNRNKKTASGILRKTSNNNYIFRSKNKVSVGYFDKSGNLVLETYDPKTDSMIKEKYIIDNE